MNPRIFKINWCIGARFYMNGATYIILSIWWKSGVKTYYEFQDRNGKKFAMPVDIFEKKITNENFIGI